MNSLDQYIGMNNDEMEQLIQMDIIQADLSIKAMRDIIMTDKRDIQC